MIGLSRVLVDAGIVDADTMADAVRKFGESEALERHLVSQNLASEVSIAQAIAAQTGHQFVNLSDTNLDSSVIAVVPAAICRRYDLIPIAFRTIEESSLGRRTASGGLAPTQELLIGMLDPTDLIAVDDVASITGFLVEPAVVTRSALEQAFSRFLRSDEELSEISATLEGSVGPSTQQFAEDLDAAEDAPVVRFVNLLISQAINDRASDIHIEPGEHHVTVRFRIDGVLKEMQRADRGIQDGIISRLKIMAQVDIAERRRPQDGRISILHDGRQIDLRVATLPTVWGEKIVMRILDNQASAVSMADLGMSDYNLARFRDALRRPHGMVLVTGPTGSGKSTTLYTSMGEVSSPQVNVITIEDPVEFRIPGIAQMQVNPKAGLTFATALRSILRGDPDVVLVGEIRDQETAIISIEAALTGHLVLSTLHTNDAPSALTRLIEIGAEPYLVATALSVAVAQRLARRLCTRCRTPIAPDHELLAELGFDFDPDNPPLIYKAVGCVGCANTGYRGRLALHEVMLVTEEMERLITHHATGSELRDLAIAQGMIPLRQDGWQKVTQGLTTVEEVLRVSL